MVAADAASTICDTHGQDMPAATHAALAPVACAMPQTEESVPL